MNASVNMSSTKSDAISWYFRGFHACKDMWDLVIDQALLCIQVPENPEDKNAIAVICEEKVVAPIAKISVHN